MATGDIPTPIHSWTALKLEYLDHYLQAYVRATRKASETHYIDAFAGCGECLIIETGRTIEGSPWRALNAKPGFTQYHFVENNVSLAAYLRQQIFQKGITNARVYTGDCNQIIPNKVLPSIPRNVPSFAFIDPYGLQINWTTIQRLAAHRRGWKMELLILHPYDMAIKRCFCLPNLSDTLTRYYGDENWQGQLEESDELEETPDQKRERFVQFYVSKLRSLGYRFVDIYGPLFVKRRPLYHFIFASDHPVGAKIMKAVWSKLQFIPGQLGFESVKRL